MKKHRLRLWEDDEEEWEDEEDEDGQCPEGLEVEGPSYAAVFTGVLNARGEPIIRHPVVMRVGFHPQRNQYHCPTMNESGFEEDDGKVFGWFYEV